MQRWSVYCTIFTESSQKTPLTSIANTAIMGTTAVTTTVVMQTESLSAPLQPSTASETATPAPESKMPSLITENSVKVTLVQYNEKTVSSFSCVTA